jgi:hypothetical protein
LAPEALREHPMMKRIAATEKTRERFRALIDGRLGTGADRSDLVRLAVQLLIEAARRSRPESAREDDGHSLSFV